MSLMKTDSASKTFKSRQMGGRQLKRKILTLLNDDEFGKSLDTVCRLPARQAVNPLFSFLYHKDEWVKWRAITAMGAVVACLAHEDIESSRIIMRRLMWNLNDESGGIGWGSPEAMGEIMARHGGLAKEYAGILVSYINEAGNYLEHEILQRGVLWGLGRLGHARPELVQNAAAYLCPFLQSKDSNLRGLAAWVTGAIPSEMTKSLLADLIDDETSINIFIDMRMVEHTVGKLAAAALSRIAP
jgi:hypothetical protein